MHRTAIVLKQLKDAGYWSEVQEVPELMVDNVKVAEATVSVLPGQVVALKGASTVYYTLDGTDPMAYTSAGAPKPSDTAQRGTGILEATGQYTVKARVRSGSRAWGPLLTRHVIVNGAEGIDDVKCASNANDDNTIYNLMGQPVANPSAGVYIQKNKKIYIR